MMHREGREWRYEQDDQDRGGRRHGEGWQRSRTQGGYGSQFGAWSAGAGFQPAGFGFGPAEDPGSHDGEPTRPARGRGAWASDGDRSGHRGRGPKGYRRSDERVRDDVCERLTDDWSVDASEITVEVKDGEVTLSGRIPTREQKRRAGECVEDIPGVRDVFNQLHVEQQYAGVAPTRRGGSR